MGRTIHLEEIGERNAADFLREVARAHETLCVVLEDGAAIDIGPSAAVSPIEDEAVSPPKLRPLPQLQGTIPPGWKEAIYETGETVPELKPLTVLPGYVPAGWKDAIYDYSDSES